MADSVFAGNLDKIKLPEIELNVRNESASEIEEKVNQMMFNHFVCQKKADDAIADQKDIVIDDLRSQIDELDKKLKVKAELQEED